MQKLKKKLNAKPVGAGLVPARNKGITLIALIITIIVMLILVGVTINVAINGRLFDTADDATRKTEKHAIYDQIVGAMKLTNNGTIKVTETYSAAETALENQGMSVSDLESDGIFTVTGNRGTYTYKITGETITIEEEPEGQEIKIVEFKEGSLETATKLNMNLEKYDGEKPLSQVISEYQAQGIDSGLNLENEFEYFDARITIIDDDDYMIFVAYGNESTESEEFLIYATSDIDGIITFDEDPYTNLKKGWMKVDLENIDSEGNIVLQELPDNYEFQTFSNLNISFKSSDSQDYINSTLEFYNTVYKGLLVVAE